MNNCNTKPRKLPYESENPIDNIIYDLIVEPFEGVFHKLGFTPNSITALSLFSGLISLKYLCEDKLHHFAFFYFLQYILDCFDGYVARKYNQETEFGDYFDHIKDYSLWAIVIYIAINKYKLNCKKNIILFLIMILLGWVVVFYFACQEKVGK